MIALVLEIHIECLNQSLLAGGRTGGQGRLATSRRRVGDKQADGQATSRRTSRRQAGWRAGGRMNGRKVDDI